MDWSEDKDWDKSEDSIREDDGWGNFEKERKQKTDEEKEIIVLNENILEEVMEEEVNSNSKIFKKQILDAKSKPFQAYNAKIEKEEFQASFVEVQKQCKQISAEVDEVVQDHYIFRKQEMTISSEIGQKMEESKKKDDQLWFEDSIDQSINKSFEINSLKSDQKSKNDKIIKKQANSFKHVKVNNKKTKNGKKGNKGKQSTTNKNQQQKNKRTNYKQPQKNIKKVYPLQKKVESPKIPKTVLPKILTQELESDYISILNYVPKDLENIQGETGGEFEKISVIEKQSTNHNFMEESSYQNLGLKSTTNVNHSISIKGSLNTPSSSETYHDLKRHNYLQKQSSSSSNSRQFAARSDQDPRGYRFKNNQNFMKKNKGRNEDNTINNYNLNNRREVGPKKYIDIFNQTNYRVEGHVFKESFDQSNITIDTGSNHSEQKHQKYNNNRSEFQKKQRPSGDDSGIDYNKNVCINKRENFIIKNHMELIKSLEFQISAYHEHPYLKHSSHSRFLSKELEQNISKLPILILPF